MYERLILCKELLSDTGSIYVHCDWHKSAYLKCVLDSIFGQDNFRNEIIWCYKTSLRCSDKSFGRNHDNILFYSKTNYSRIHTDKTDFPVSESTIKRWSAYADENGFVSNKHFAGSNSTIMNTEDETKGFNINNGIPVNALPPTKLDNAPTITVPIFDFLNTLIKTDASKIKTIGLPISSKE